MPRDLPIDLPADKPAKEETRGEKAAKEADKEARKTKPKDRPPKDTINASLVLTPEEYARIPDKSEWHKHAYPVELGEPAVVDGYLVFDDHRIPRVEEGA